MKTYEFLLAGKAMPIRISAQDLDGAQYRLCKSEGDNILDSVDRKERAL